MLHIQVEAKTCFLILINRFTVPSKWRYIYFLILTINVYVVKVWNAAPLGFLFGTTGQDGWTGNCSLCSFAWQQSHWHLIVGKRGQNVTPQPQPLSRRHSPGCLQVRLRSTVASSDTEPSCCTPSQRQRSPKSPSSPGRCVSSTKRRELDQSPDSHHTLTNTPLCAHPGLRRSLRRDELQTPARRCELRLAHCRGCCHGCQGRGFLIYALINSIYGLAIWSKFHISI